MEVSPGVPESGEQHSQPKRERRPALILAGGGMKVAFQAGALQVLLDEADLGFREFPHADGCSGGVFNLAMWCQGYSGTEIADKWRHFPVKSGIQLNWRKYWKLIWTDSIFAMDRFRRNILRKHWELEWTKIRCMPDRPNSAATFNAYDFSTQRLMIREAPAMDEDFLVACVALPRWFPPVPINGDTYIDGVFITDANLEEAIRRGANELWVIWTVSRRNRWVNGFIGNYFGVIETAANGHFARMCDRIERNNELVAAGREKEAEFHEHIGLKIIRGEVPLHYLLNLNPDRFTQAVELGVSAARQWCLRHGVPLNPAPPSGGSLVSLHFHERMDGSISRGLTDYEEGGREGHAAATEITLRLEIHVDDVDRFISHPDHTADVSGTIACGRQGEMHAVTAGRFNLMPFLGGDDGDTDERWMLYWLPFTKDARSLVLSGYKLMRDDPGHDLWADTTTLYVHILDGVQHPAEPPPVQEMLERFRRGEDEPVGRVVAAGITHVDVDDFIKLLASITTDGPSKHTEVAAKARFYSFFVGGLWDVYANEALPASPF